MADINSIVIVGRLTRDVEVSYTNGGFAIGNGAVAVSHFNKNKAEEVSYIDIKILGKMAESLKQYLTKGKQIGIEGYLKQDRWEQEGQKRSRLYVVVDNIQLLGGNGGNNQNGGSYGGAGYDADGYSYN